MSNPDKDPHVECRRVERELIDALRVQTQEPAKVSQDISVDLSFPSIVALLIACMHYGVFC